MSADRLIEYSPYKVIRRRNRTCPYCGVALGKDATKDHVIGKRFGPKGALAAQWNIELWACRECNSVKKAGLENFISSVSMQPDAWGEFVDERVRTESDRKWSSRSPITNRVVAESQESLITRMSFMPGVECSFYLNGPPQIDPKNAAELARMQLSSIFYLQTYDAVRRIGKLLPRDFYAFRHASRLDWGNTTFVAFMQLVADWKLTCHGIGADGFFKVAIRKHPFLQCRAWALEWNKQIRIIGFFGEQAAAIGNSVPRPEMTVLERTRNCITRCREEVPLPQDEDTLFILN